MRRLNDEAGAAAVFVAFLLVLLLGLGALVLDVGNSYWERRQLQNGADAGALAVALDLANDIIDQDASPSAGDLAEPYTGTAKAYADANAADGVSDIESLELDPVDGLPLTQAGEVTATTLVNDAGENTLSHWLAPFLGFDNTVINAPASAIYGAVGAVGGAFPVTICEDVINDAGTNTLVEIEIKIGPPGQAEDVETSCQTSDSWDGPSPGNFNWLDTDGSSCTADLEIGEEIEGDSDPGANLPNECQGEEADIRSAIESFPGAGSDQYDENRELRTRYLAIFSTIGGPGQDTYTISGLAAFEFTGINLRPGNQQAVITDPSYSHAGWINPECGLPQSRCVQGFFRSEVIKPWEIDEFEIVPGAPSDLLGVKLTR